MMGCMKADVAFFALQLFFAHLLILFCFNPNQSLDLGFC